MLAYRRALPEWLLYVSVVVDMALLLGLIYFLHYKYAQTAVFYLKAPALLYVFLFIAPASAALRGALRDRSPA